MRTPAGILLRTVIIWLLAMTLTGCEVIGGLLPDDLRDGRSVPEEAFCVEYEVLPLGGQEVTPELVEQTRTIIEERVNALGVAEPVVLSRDANHISVELPGLAAEDITEVRSLVGTTGELEFMPVPDALQGTVGEGRLPEGMKELEPLFTGVEIDSAALAQDQTTGEIVVDLQLKETGARLFDDYAAEHYGDQFAIVLDDRVMSAPAIRATRFGGQAQISGGPGGFSVNEANRLVTVLRTGPLPLPVRKVGEGACGGVLVPATGAKVTGTIVLPEEAVLPEGATWRVRLEDTPRAVAPAVLVAEADGVTGPAMTEIRFEIPYDMDGLDPAATHTLRARVDDADGVMRFISEAAIPVTTDGTLTEGVSLPVVDARRGGFADGPTPAVSQADVAAPAEDLRVGRSLGNPDAPIRIDVFADPQCPPCAAYAEYIEPLLIGGPVADGEVFLTYKDFPFISPESLDAAVAMRVAEAMGGKFWDYHALVFHNQHGVEQGAFSLARLADMAELVGLDRAAFLAEMWDPTIYQEVVVAETAEAAALGLSSVPSVLVNGQPIPGGVPTWDVLSAAIEAAASGAG